MESARDMLVACILWLSGLHPVAEWLKGCVARVRLIVSCWVPYQLCLLSSRAQHVALEQPWQLRVLVGTCCAACLLVQNV